MPFHIIFVLGLWGMFFDTTPRNLNTFLQPCFQAGVLTQNEKYRKYPNLVHTQDEIISDLNYLVCILFER